MSAALTIEVVSDVICPWCYIGKRRLGKALAALEGEVSAEIRWLPFQLNPRMPPEGMARAAYRAAKFGSIERSRELDARVAGEGKSEGIAFAFERIERTPNTVAAHALVGLAQEQGRADALLDALFRAYFVDGIDISSTDNTVAVCARFGLKADSVRTALADPAIKDRTRSEVDKALARGAFGSPYIVVDGEPFWGSDRLEQIDKWLETGGW